MKTDLTLQDQVLQELRWDGRVDAAEVGVTVQDGVVTLTGTVRSFVERNAAEKAALHVAGVLDVANDIHVSLGGSHTRTDAEIAQTVRAALERDTTVAHERIQSSVSDGVVTLFGRLDNWHQVTAAENAVTNLAGGQRRAERVARARRAGGLCCRSVGNRGSTGAAGRACRPTDRGLRA